MRIFNKMKKMLLVAAASLFCAGATFAEVKTGTYTVAEGDMASGAQITSVEGITLTYGTADDWTSGGGTSTVGDQTFPVYATCSATNPSPNNGKVPTAGAYIVLNPQYAGTVTVAVSNAAVNKNVYVVKDEDDNLVNGSVVIDGTVTEWTSGTPCNAAAKYNGGVTFDVEAGATYYFYLSGSKMRFNGFIYTYDDAPAAGGDASAGYDLTAYNEAVAAAEAYKATLNPEDEMDAMLIESVDYYLESAASWLEDVKADSEATQADVDLIAEDLNNNIAILKVQAEIETLRAEGQEVLALYPEETRTDNAGLVLALRNLPTVTLGYTLEQLTELRDAVKTAIPAFRLENNQLILDTAAKKATDYAATLDASEETGTAVQIEAYNTLTYYASEEVLAQIDVTSYDAVMEYSQTIDVMLAQYQPAIEKEKTIMAATTAVAEAQATLAAGGTDEAGLADAIAKVNTILGEINMWDTEYTLADLTAAVEAMEAAEEAFLATAATTPVETLVEITSEWIVNADFEQVLAGWSNDGHGAQEATSGNAIAKIDGEILSGKWVETWKGSAYDADVYQTIVGLPAGTYTYKMAAFCENCSAAYVYANAEQAQVSGTDQKYYSVTVTIAEGESLRVGYKVTGAIYWSGMDNAKLFQTTTTTLVAEQEALAEVVDSVAKLKASYAAPVEVEALDAAVAAVDNSTVESCKASVEALYKAMDAFVEANEFNLKVLALAGATAENPMDATFLIKNPNFTTDGSYWEGAPTVGGEAANRCAEKWNCTFDVYQDVTNMPDGLYTVSVQAFYRAGGYGETVANKDQQNVILYAGDATVPVMSILDDAGKEGMPADVNIDGYGYVPNGMSTASQAFTAGLYANNSLQVVVEGGTLRIGIKKETTIDNDWAIFDNFQLTYHGVAKSELDVAVDSLSTLIAEATAWKAELNAEDEFHAQVIGMLDQMIPAAQAVADARESLETVNQMIFDVYSTLGTYKPMVEQYDAKVAASAAIEEAKALLATYTEYTDAAGFVAAIANAENALTDVNMSMATLEELAAAVEAMRTAKEAFVKENTPAITEPVVKMTYVDYDQPATAMGEIAAGATARAGFNKISEGSVAFGNTGWGENKITYIQVDASCYTGDIVSAELTVEVSGSTDSKRVTAWGIGYNSSVWSADMTYETADKTITTMGDLQSTSTKSASTFETKTFDILDAFKNDEDKVVTLVVYETAAAGGYIKNPVVAIEAANADEITTYTVKYVDEAGADIADAFTANIMIGEKAALTAEDKANKYNADNTKKYIYVSCDRDSIVTVADSASNVITATFREAATYNYTVEAVDDSGILARTLGSYSNFEGESVKAPYNAYVLVEGTLYQAEATNKEYNKSLTLTEDNMKVQVVYAPTTIENVVYYQEAEDVEGLTLATNANTGVRSSNSASAYAAEADVVLTNLAAGKYTLTAVVCDTKKAMDAAFSFIAGTDTVLTTASSAVNWSSSTSKEFTLAGETAISLAKGGNSMQAVDFVYIQKTGDVELPAKIAYLNKEGDTDDAIYDALVAGGYVVDALVYADSTLTAEMIEANLAGYDVVVLGGSTGSSAALAKTYTQLLGKVNVLSTKAFWYAAPGDGGSKGTNPGSADAPSLSIAKAAGYEGHPIYAGIEGDEFAVFNDMGKSTGRYLQGNGSFGSNTPEQATIGTTLGADCIGEAWVDGFGWIIIPVDGLQPSGYLTADGAQLFVNAVEYLIAGEEYVAPVAPDAIEGVRVEATQWPADIYDLSGRMVKKAATSLEGLEKGLYIINGKKVLVK